MKATKSYKSSQRERERGTERNESCVKLLDTQANLTNEILTQALVLNMPRQLQDCPICLLTVNRRRQGRSCHTCHKRFHKSCLRHWLDVSGVTTCPHCRMDLLGRPPQNGWETDYTWWTPRAPIVTHPDDEVHLNTNSTDRALSICQK